jgi:parvulin-like peptidyl-prolyl isomerase
MIMSKIDTLRKIFALMGMATLISCSYCALAASRQTVPELSRPKKEQEIHEVVARVGSRTITRQDVLKEYMFLQPAEVAAFLKKRYPTRTDLRTPPDLIEYWNDTWQQSPTALHNVACTLIYYAGIEEAALQSGIQIKDEEVEAKVHAQYVGRAQSAELPPGMSDEEIAARFGESVERAKIVMRRLLLVDSLILADMTDRLKHPICPDDFFQASLIDIPAEPKKNGKPGEIDMEAAKAKIEAIRADVLAARITFEAAAKQFSKDASAYHGGKLPPMIKTMLKPAMETVLLELKPGELTSPLLYENGYALLRLDKTKAQLSEMERKRALQFCLSIERRRDQVIAERLKDIKWTASVGEMPAWIKNNYSVQNNPGKKPSS